MNHSTQKSTLRIDTSQNNFGLTQVNDSELYIATLDSARINNKTIDNVTIEARAK